MHLSRLTPRLAVTIVVLIVLTLAAVIVASQSSNAKAHCVVLVNGNLVDSKTGGAIAPPESELPDYSEWAQKNCVRRVRTRPRKPSQRHRQARWQLSDKKLIGQKHQPDSLKHDIAKITSP